MTAVLVLGSNSGDRERNIRTALISLKNIAEVNWESDVYASPDCYGSGRKYLNMVVLVTPFLKESDFNRNLKVIERQAGRNHENSRKEEVPLDIDIVIWDNEIRRNNDFNAYYFKKGYELLKDHIELNFSC